MADELTGDAQPSPEPVAPVAETAPIVEAAPVVPGGTPPVEPAPIVAQPEGDAALPPDGQTPPEPEAAPVERVVPAPSEYVLPEGTPETFRQMAHDKGFTQEQVESTQEYMALEKEASKATIKAMGEAHLLTWGDEAKTNMTLARAGLKSVDPTGAVAAAIKEMGWESHPVAMDLFLSIGKSGQEGGFLKQPSPGGGGQKKQDMAHRMYPNDVPK